MICAACGQSITASPAEMEVHERAARAEFVEKFGREPDINGQDVVICDECNDVILEIEQREMAAARVSTRH